MKNRALLLTALLIGPVGALVAPAEAIAVQQDLTASARASVAEALYAASATSAAAQRVSDERIFEQRRQIEDLQSKLRVRGPALRS